MPSSWQRCSSASRSPGPTRVTSAERRPSRAAATAAYRAVPPRRHGAPANSSRATWPTARRSIISERRTRGAGESLRQVRGVEMSDAPPPVPRDEDQAATADLAAGPVMEGRHGGVVSQRLQDEVGIADCRRPRHRAGADRAEVLGEGGADRVTADAPPRREREERGRILDECGHERLEVEPLERAQPLADELLCSLTHGHISRVTQRDGATLNSTWMASPS